MRSEALASERKSVDPVTGRTGTDIPSDIHFTQQPFRIAELSRRTEGGANRTCWSVSCISESWRKEVTGFTLCGLPEPFWSFRSATAQCSGWAMRPCLHPIRPGLGLLVFRKSPLFFLRSTARFLEKFSRMSGILRSFGTFFSIVGDRNLPSGRGS